MSSPPQPGHPIPPPAVSPSAASSSSSFAFCCLLSSSYSWLPLAVSPDNKKNIRFHYSIPKIENIVMITIYFHNLVVISLSFSYLVLSFFLYSTFLIYALKSLPPPSLPLFRPLSAS